jgi:hypothetical protein
MLYVLPNAHCALLTVDCGLWTVNFFLIFAPLNTNYAT